MIRHISAIAEVVDDVDDAVEFYRDVLGLTVDHQPSGGYATVEIPGTLHFSVCHEAPRPKLLMATRTPPTVSRSAFQWSSKSTR